MLICLPTQADAGAADTICDHFGSAPFFTLYDSESDQFTILKNKNDQHSHGTCHPLSQLMDHQIDGVVRNRTCITCLPSTVACGLRNSRTSPRE